MLPLCPLPAADSTFDSGQGSTVYSDSQSSQQSVVLGSLVDAAPPAQSLGSTPASASDVPGLPQSLPPLVAFPQPVAVSRGPCWGPTRGPPPTGLRSAPSPPCGEPAASPTA